jgi:hypothetical protein
MALILVFSPSCDFPCKRQSFYQWCFTSCHLKEGQMSEEKSAGRLETLLTKDVGGVPLVLLLCLVAAIALGFGVAMTATGH